jgi:phosphopantothenate synthetase
VELKDIKDSLGELSDEALRDLLMGIRGNRRVSKAKPAAVAKRATAKKKKPEASIDALLAALSPEQVAQLLNQLGGK